MLSYSAKRSVGVQLLEIGLENVLRGNIEKLPGGCPEALPAPDRDRNARRTGWKTVSGSESAVVIGSRGR